MIAPTPLSTDRRPFAATNCAPQAMQHFSGLLTPIESNRIIDRAEAHFEQRGFGPWAAKLRRNREFIGFIGLSVPNFEAPFMPSVEIGWRLATPYWGKGLATEGAKAVIFRAFAFLKLPALVSFTVPENTRSRRVMEKLNMTHNPADDFDHPKLPAGHPLRHHMLSRLVAQNAIY
jgi:RimJ/RimL family protein N-acetyltransferase